MVGILEHVPFLLLLLKGDLFGKTEARCLVILQTASALCSQTRIHFAGVDMYGYVSVLYAQGVYHRAHRHVDGSVQFDRRSQFR